MTEFVNDYYQPQMQNGEFVTFHNETLEEMERADVAKWFKAELDTYRSSVSEVNTTFTVFSASSISQKLAALDKRRDQCYSALKSIVKFHANDDEDTAKAAAAERIMFIIRKTATEAGNPLRTGQLKGTAAINTLLASLDPARQDIELLDIAGKVEKLTVVNREFEDLQINRDTEKGEKPSGNMQPVRLAATAAYNEVVAMINAQIRLHKDEALARFARTHNATIDRFKNQIAQRKGRAEDK